MGLFDFLFCRKKDEEEELVEVPYKLEPMEGYVAQSTIKLKAESTEQEDKEK